MTFKTLNNNFANISAIGIIEASTTEIAINKDANGFVENRKAAIAGGRVAGKARADLQKAIG